MIKFYCHCLPNIAQTLKSLNEALKGSTKYFKWSARFYVDASDSHDGAVLQYIQNRGWVPLSFVSKQLDSTQSKYSALDRKLSPISGIC